MVLQLSNSILYVLQDYLHTTYTLYRDTAIEICTLAPSLADGPLLAYAIARLQCSMTHLILTSVMTVSTIRSVDEKITSAKKIFDPVR